MYKLLKMPKIYLLLLQMGLQAKYEFNDIWRRAVEESIKRRSYV